MMFFLKKLLVPPLGRMFITTLASTLKPVVRGSKELKKLELEGEHVIFAFWHGSQFYPVYYFRNKNICVMSSMSRDGEIQTRTLQGMGYSIVRGSSTRGGVQGLLGLIHYLKEKGHVAIAVDGPRGPYHVPKEGIGLIARKSGRPVIPLGVAFSSKKVLNAWDRYELPYPFSRVVLIIGRPLYYQDFELEKNFVKYVGIALEYVTGEAEKLLRDSEVRTCLETES